MCQKFGNHFTLVEFNIKQYIRLMMDLEMFYSVFDVLGLDFNAYLLVS